MTETVIIRLLEARLAAKSSRKVITVVRLKSVGNTNFHLQDNQNIQIFHHFAFTYIPSMNHAIFLMPTLCKSSALSDNFCRLLNRPSI